MFDPTPNLSGLRKLDDNAWTEAFPWIAGKARLAAQRFLQKPQEIEDVVADTLESVVSQIEKVKDINHLAGLTVVISRRRALDCLRKNKNHEEIDEPSRTKKRYPEKWKRGPKLCANC